MDLFQMDFFIYILILMLVVGAFFVIYGGFAKKEPAAGQEEKEELLSLTQKLDTLESSVYEADEAVHMLGDMSKNVFKEFDSKYQELLFLYNLVDEKQKNLTSTDSTEVVSMNTSSDPNPVVVRDVPYAGESPVPRRKTVAVKRPAAMTQIVPDNGKTSGTNRASPDATADDSTASSGINPKFAYVLKLSQEGKSVEEIARELDMGKGEIMLILNLGGRRQNA
jgi:hypothetical protein